MSQNEIDRIISSITDEPRNSESNSSLSGSVHSGTLRTNGDVVGHGLSSGVTTRLANIQLPNIGSMWGPYIKEDVMYVDIEKLRRDIHKPEIATEMLLLLLEQISNGIDRETIKPELLQYFRKSSDPKTPPDEKIEF